MNPGSHFVIFAIVFATLQNLVFIRAAENASTLTIAPAGQTGLFSNVGPLNPHAYRPNEFFSSNWVYEGLVHWKDGQVAPALASSWSERDGPNNTYIITFELRQDVVFHDGSPWDASVAVANFDNVLAEPLVSPDYHAWYDLVMRIKSWTALDTYTFELVLDSPYYPALQELTYIRPLRMLSMNAMPGNGGNTCPPGWGTLQSDDGVTVDCKGHTAPIGTGPYLFTQTITNKRIVSADQVAAFELDEGEEVTEVHFTANANYWGGTPAINQLVVRSYASHTDVLEALLDQSLDVAHSSLEPQDIKVARDVDELTVQLSPPLNTRLIVLNSARGPTQSLAVRKAIVHGINKAHIVQKELGSLEEAAHSAFSRNTPYANIDLYPLLDFDAEKAALLLEADGWVMERGRRSRQGENLTLEFIYVEDNAVHKAIEDDVRADLAKLGIDVKAVPLDKDEWNVRATSGEFELAFSETWGPPYDPHTFAASWRVRNEADYAAQLGMRNDNADFAAPMNKTELDQAITDVLATEDETQRQEIWTRILTAIHEQAIYEPISFMRNTAVMNQGFENFLFGGQQFDIPVAQLRATNSAEGAATAQESGSNGLSAGAIAGITVAAVCAVLAFAAMLALIYRERQGKPMFAPLLASEKRSDMA